jgi:hypothetical protein
MEASLYRHLSFQEFLTPMDLADPTNHMQDQTLRWYLRGEDWWREVLTFYVGLSKKPLEICRWLDTVTTKTQAKGGKSITQRVTNLRSAIADAFQSLQTRDLAYLYQDGA